MYSTIIYIVLSTSIVNSSTDRIYLVFGNVFGCAGGWGQALSGAESMRVHSSKNAFNPSHAFDAVRPQYTSFKGRGKPDNVGHLHGFILKTAQPKFYSLYFSLHCYFCIEPSA